MARGPSPPKTGNSKIFKYVLFSSITEFRELAAFLERRQMPILEAQHDVQIMNSFAIDKQRHPAEDTMSSFGKNVKIPQTCFTISSAPSRGPRGLSNGQLAGPKIGLSGNNPNVLQWEQKGRLMPSRKVTRLDNESRQVMAGAHQMAESVAVDLQARFAELLEPGETAPDWALVQRLTGRLIGRTHQNLIELDHQLEIGRTTNKKLRNERSSLENRLRAELRAARFLLDETFGKDLGGDLFRWRRLARLNARSMVLLARETAASLRTPQLALTKLTEGTPSSLGPVEQVASALETKANALESHLEQLEPNQKQEVFEVGRKEQEWQEAHRSRLAAQDLLFGLYKAAGHDHLASRLRPKVRVRSASEEMQEGGTTMPPAEAQKGQPIEAQG